MIKRETYMSRIRPFIGNDLVKVLTGIIIAKIRIKNKPLTIFAEYSST